MGYGCVVSVIIACYMTIWKDGNPPLWADVLREPWVVVLSSLICLMLSMHYAHFPPESIVRGMLGVMIGVFIRAVIVEVLERVLWGK